MSDSDFNKRQLQQLRALSQGKEAGAAYSKRSAVLEQSRASSARWRLMLLIGALVFGLLLVGWQLVRIQIEYSKLIAMINKYRPRTWLATGFETALALSIPALSGWLHFPTPALPVAADFSFRGLRDNEIKRLFMQDPTKHLAQMWEYALVGSNNPQARTSLSALTIMCEGWACEAGVKLCLPACPEFNPNWVNVAVTGFTSGSMGLMAGMAAGPGKAAAAGATAAGGPGGAAIGIGAGAFVVVGGAAAALSYLSQKHTYDASRAAVPNCVAPQKQDSSS